MARKITGAAVALILTAFVAVDARAQGGPKGGEPGPGPGMMMGPGMMGPVNFRFSCNPRAAGLAEWRISRIEAAVKPNEAQTVKLSELRAASLKAAETITSACSGDMPAKSTERLALMEKRVDAMQQAIRIIRPAFEAFYASLDSEQQAKLDAIGPRRWGWRNWRWPWS
jgi:hypothetical protein